MRWAMALSNMVNRVSEIISSIGIVIIAVVFMLEVLFRYILQWSLVWSLEVNRISFVWVCFLGATVALKRGAHVRFEFIIGNMPPRWRELILLLGQALIIIFLVFMIRQGWTSFSLARTTRFPTLGISQGILYFPLPLSGAILLLHTLVDSVERLTNFIKKDTKTAPGQEAF